MFDGKTYLAPKFITNELLNLTIFANDLSFYHFPASFDADGDNVRLVSVVQQNSTHLPGFINRQNMELIIKPNKNDIGVYTIDVILQDNSLLKLKSLYSFIIVVLEPSTKTTNTSMNSTSNQTNSS